MSKQEINKNIHNQNDQNSSELRKIISGLEKELKTLKENEKRFRLMIENTNEAFVVAQDEKIKYCNSQITDLTGYSVAEANTMKISDLVHPEDRERVMLEYRTRLSRKKEKNSYQIRIKTKDDKVKHIIVSSSFIIWDDAPASLAILSDISQLKKAESDLIRSEEKFRQLMEQSPLAMELLSPDGKILVVNNAWKKLWEIGESEATETIEKYNMLTDPQLIELGIMDMVKEAFQGKHIILPPIRYNAGQTKEDFDITFLIDVLSPWIQCHLFPVLDMEGNISFIVNTYVDITDLKIAGEMLKKSKDDFQLLMETTPLAISIWAPDGKNIQVNNAWKKLWGLTEEETTQILEEYNFLTDKEVKRHGHTSLIERAFKGEQIIVPPMEYIGNRTLEDLEMEDLEAFTRWIQVHLHSVKNESGEIEYVVATNTDFTELKKIEQKAEVQRESLARVDRASSMGQLTGSIAHELNQPLTGILSNVQAIQLMISKDIWDKHELNEILTDIVNDTKRAGSVIHNLRELYREQKVEFNPIDICNLVEETLQLLHSELILQDITINIECPPSLPVVYGTKVMIQQVLVNLIQNGIQAMSQVEKDDRDIRIKAVHGGNVINISVTDKGCGIDSDKIDNIFEPMVTWKPGGTGMGLAISNSIIEAHGGKMWAKNNSGGGATLGFSIPIPAKTI